MALPTKITLEVVTPDRAIVNETVDEVELPGTEGYFGVLPGHTPLLSSLQVGEMWYRIGRRSIRGARRTRPRARTRGPAALRNPEAHPTASRRLGDRPHAAVKSQRASGRLHPPRNRGALLPVTAAALVVGSRANGAAQGRPPCDTGRPPPARAPAVRGGIHAPGLLDPHGDPVDRLARAEGSGSVHHDAHGGGRRLHLVRGRG